MKKIQYIKLILSLCLLILGHQVIFPMSNVGMIPDLQEENNTNAVYGSYENPIRIKTNQNGSETFSIQWDYDSFVKNKTYPGVYVMVSSSDQGNAKVKITTSFGNSSAFGNIVSVRMLPGKNSNTFEDPSFIGAYIMVIPNSYLGAYYTDENQIPHLKSIAVNLYATLTIKVETTITPPNPYPGTVLGTYDNPIVVPMDEYMTKDYEIDWNYTNYVTQQISSGIFLTIGGKDFQSSNQLMKISIEVSSGISSTFAGMADMMRGGVLVDKYSNEIHNSSGFIIAPIPNSLKGISCDGPGLSDFFKKNSSMSLGKIKIRVKIEPYFPNEKIAKVSSDHNYIKTRVYTRDGAVASGEATFIENIQYFDALSRPSQLSQVGIAPRGMDLNSLQEYDGFGRESTSWLPGDNTQEGKYIDEASLKKTAISSNLSDQNPYSSTEYELSPLGRVKREIGPGSAWHTGKIGVTSEYLTNSSTTGVLSCIYFSVTGVNEKVALKKNGNYASGDLNVTKHTDEDKNVSYEFKDKFGQTVLTRQMIGTTQHDTYYVYDDFGNLCYVLPPIAVDQVTSYVDNDTKMKQLAYVYKYDNRNRCIWKRLPGCEEIFYIYDKADRLIFSQDGEQRAKGEWLFSIPDNLGRVVLTGLCKNTYNYAANPLASTLVKAQYNTSRTNLANSYTISGVTLNSSSILTANFYDDYAFMGITQLPNNDHTKYNAESGFGVKHTSAQELLTGTLVAQMNSDGTLSTTYLYSVLYYDRLGRLIQTKSNNHLSGTEKEYVAYNRIGDPTKKKHVHTAKNSTTTEVYDYEYDHTGRLVATHHTLGNGVKTPIAVNSYDSRGRLFASKKGKHSNLYTSYTYNVRSWTKSISSPLFTQTLFYNDTYGGSKAQYGGNISAMSWKTHNDNRTHGYAFTYDALSRINAATYLLNGSAPSTHNYKVESISYDKHGNIKGLKRYGKTSTGETFALVDNLTMDYNGNQLTRVADAATGSIFSASSDFKDKTSAAGTIEYTYNKNGAMRSDLNKGITSIDYNSLNLPRQMIINSSTKAKNYYTYSASGVKLKTEQRYHPTLQTAPVGTTTPANDGLIYYKNTDYVGNIIYETTKTEVNTRNNTRILIDGGYIENGVYHFYLTDHLGNNRVVANASGTVIQKNHYYPFGMTFAENTELEQEKQPYKYNGKELDQMHGLNLYDYSARYYEPAIGRFMTMDPLAEKYYSISPYVYCANNPILNIDPDGKDYWSTTDTEAIKAFLNFYQEQELLGMYGLNFNYAIADGWTHATDAEFVSYVNSMKELTFNDETGIYYTSYNIIGKDGIVSAIGVSLNGELIDGNMYISIPRAFYPQGGQIDAVYPELYLLAPARAGFKLTKETIVSLFGAMSRATGTTNTIDASKNGITPINNREKMGRAKGNMPGNNQVQNKQIQDLSKKHNLSKEKQRELHDMISGEGLGYHEIEQIIIDFLK